MKEHFSINLFLTILITSFITGCSNDENNKDLNSSIIGKWQLVSVSPKEIAKDYDECEFEGYIVFESNGTYSDHRPCDVNEIGGGKWELDGNNVEIISDILPIPFKFAIELSDNTLILSQNSTYYNEDWELVPCVLKQTYQRID